MYSKTLPLPFSHVTLYSFSGSTLCLQYNVTLEPLSTYFLAIKSTSTSDCPSVGGKGRKMRNDSSSSLFALALGLAGCRPVVNNSHSTGPLAYPILINPLASLDRVSKVCLFKFIFKMNISGHVAFSKHIVHRISEHSTCHAMSLIILEFVLASYRLSRNKLLEKLCHNFSESCLSVAGTSGCWFCLNMAMHC